MGIEKESVTNGQWWTGDKAVPIKCDQCAYWHKQRPTVIRYIPERDLFKDWESKYPGVTTTGWVLWAWCRKRGGRYEDWFRAATDTEVRLWDTKANGWHRNDGDGRRRGQL